MTTLTTLKEALDKNSAILGKDYALLGKPSRFGYKTYLSYDRKKGWEIVTLGIISRIFRKSFALYSTTHQMMWVQPHLMLESYKIYLIKHNSSIPEKTDKKVKDFVKKYSFEFAKKIAARGKTPIDWRIRYMKEKGEIALKFSKK